MPFEPTILSHLENILSDSFEYHNELDNFLLRTGIESSLLKQARSNAETRRQQSQRVYNKAPKRFVVQEIINLLQHSGEKGDKLLSSLTNEVIKPAFLSLTSSTMVKQSIESILEQINNNRKQRAETDKEKESFRQQQEQLKTKSKEAQYLDLQKKRDLLKAQFLELESFSNAQQRGFAFEKFLSSYFELENLEPRSSFKIIGEQIDGSFIFQNKTHLLEAKWTKDKCAGAEFSAFMFKLEGKSADTRGLFISINGYSQEALEALKHKGKLFFICIDGTHLMRSLEATQTLRGYLEKLWRHASETGTAYLPASLIK